MATYEIRLSDRLTSAARSAFDSVQRLERGVSRLSDSLSSGLTRSIGDSRGRMRDLGGRFTTSFFEGALGAARRGTRGLMGTLGLDGLNRRVTFGDVASGAMAAAGALGLVGGAIARNVIELASFRESSLAALETVMGSGEAAGRTFQNAITVANQTPLDTRDVVATFQRLAVAGFSERELAPLAAATADIGAAFGRTASDSFGLVVSQMRSAGKMDRGDLRQLLNSGVNTGEVLDSIARQMNITGATERARRQSVLAALSHGRVSGDVGIQAALDATRNRLDRGDALGTFARRQSETLTGALSNASNAWDNLLLGFGSERLPGVTAFRDGVLAVTGALDGSQPAGRALRGLVSDVVNELGGSLGGAFDEEGLSTFTRLIEFARPILVDVVRGILDLGRGFGSGFMGTLGPVIEALDSFGARGEGSSDTMQQLGRALGFVTAAFVLGVGVVFEAVAALVDLYDLVTRIPDALSGLGERARGFAGDMADGFILGLDEQWTRVTAKVDELATSVSDSVRAALHIRSPSRVMMELGGYTAEGFAVGIDGGRDRVGRSLEGLTGLGGGAAPALAGMGGAAGPTVQVFVTAQVAPGASPDEAGAVIGDAIVARLVEVFETLNAGPSL